MPWISYGLPLNYSPSPKKGAFKNLDVPRLGGEIDYGVSVG